METARRELFEETGATEFNLEAVCVYSVKREGKDINYGILCYATINYLDILHDSEIEYINFFDEEPKNLTYPDIQPKLLKKVLESKQIV